MRQTPKRFRGARTCLRSSITMPSFVGLGYHPPLGQPKRLSFFCLSVSLSVCSSRFWTSEIVVRPISPWRRWSTETIVIPLDRGRFVVVHPCSTVNFLRLLPIGNTTKCWSPKNCKNWSFPHPQDDRINWSRRNFTGKRISWVCYRTPYLALIGKRGSVQESPKCQNLPKIVVFGNRKPTQ